MPLRVVNARVTVARDDGKGGKKRVVPPIKDPAGFDFTDEEIEQFNSVSPNTLTRVVQELPDDEGDEAPAKPAKKATAGGKAAPKPSKTDDDEI